MLHAAVDNDTHSAYLRRVLLSMPAIGLAQPAGLAKPPLVRVALDGATSAALHGEGVDVVRWVGTLG